MTCLGGANMKMMLDKYIIVADGEIIKSYKHFKQALKDLGFYSIMYHDVRIYQQIETE